MAFKSERIPPIEKETSEFLKQARQILRTGYSRHDAWTVDREHNRVLKYTGRGREIDECDEEYWKYLDETGYYSFVTKQVSFTLISKGPPMTVRITRDIQFFWAGERYKGLPDEHTIQLIKEAFLVHGWAGIVSQEDNEVSLHTLLWNGVAV